MPAATIMTPNPALVGTRRYLGQTQESDDTSLGELGVLAFAGVAATICSYTIDGWGIPGSAVLQGILPMAAGLAVVPRHGAGAIMGSTSLCTGLIIIGMGIGQINPSSLARLALLGLCLEVGPARASRRGLVWAWFVFAGLSANLLGYGLKLLFATAGLEGFGGRALAWPWTIFSFAVCGALAGGISAIIFFRRPGRESQAITK